MANEGSLDNTSDTKPLILKAIATERIRKRPGRTDYQRLECYIDDDGELKIRSAGSQSSGVLSSFGRSNCYAILEQARGNVEVGEAVDVLLFGPLIK
jgi:molybdopterin molybdotransferase